ncbi:MAG: hypothetical protein DRI01_00700 [Chloroflexi bacterium]|nr:MAG: hypothetical protein DRI01_00700 [Chloroflexota bacterium]
MYILLLEKIDGHNKYDIVRKNEWTKRYIDNVKCKVGDYDYLVRLRERLIKKTTKKIKEV